MAPRRGAHAVEDEGPQEQEAGLVKLQFDEPLSWRAGKAIPASELHRRLDALSKELVDLEQETTDKDSVTKVAKELVSHNLLGHKDKGVKAFTACCLVDILRICAPHAPFTHAQLKDVFSLFINSILPALSDPSHTYNAQHKYVLDSLSDVQSIVLLNDVDNNDTLLLNLFSSLFDTVSGSKSPSGDRIPADVIRRMGELLVTLIEEGTNLPPKVVDVIMAQFLRAAAPGGRDRPADVDENQSTLLLKDEPEAYQMAKSICNNCPERMSRFVAQYFSDVIMDFSGITNRSTGPRGGADSDDEDMLGPSDADLRELRKAHKLLRELWRAAPGVLQNVIAQLDAELSADNVHLRQLATETLGDMISGIGAAGPPPLPHVDPAIYPLPRLADEDSLSPSTNVLTTPRSPQSFAQTHAGAYHNFVSRKNDKSPVIRASWTLAVGYIISTSAGGIGLNREEEISLVQGLGEKLLDSDEKVRLAAIKALETFSLRDIVTKIAPNGGMQKEGSVLNSLADRCRDKRSNVRVEAMALLGKLWAAASGELLAGNDAVSAALSPIPLRIFKCLMTSDHELNVLVDRVTFEYLVPLSYPPSKKAGKSANGASQSQTAAAPSFDADAVRAERILLMVRDLDAEAKRAFFGFQGRQQSFASIIQTMIKVMEAYNGGVTEGNEAQILGNMQKTLDYLAQYFPDQPKFKSDLTKFAKANDRRNYQLIKYVVSPESDFKVMHRAIKELIKRLQGANAVILDTLIPLLYRSGYIIFNRSHIASILEYSKSDQSGLSAAAHEILNEMSSRNPEIFKTHIGEVCKDLVSRAPTATKPNEPAVVDTLKACASYAHKYPQEIPSDKNFTQTLISYALYGQPPKAAKYAVNILLSKKDNKSMVNATDLLQKATKGWKYGSKNFLNALAAVSQLELLASKVAEEADDEILDMTVQKILLEVRGEAKEKGPEWVDDADLDEEGQAKILALKTVVNRLLGTEDLEDAKVKAKPVMKMLKALVTKNGEICKTKDTPKHHKTRLRLLAAQLILKLCKHKHFDELLTPMDFNNLAWVTQDAHPQVRRGFVEKLQKYLVQGKLRPRFYTIIFLTAFEPVAEFKQRIETWVRSRTNYFQALKQSVMEGTMARLISLLAHHPDYSPDLNDLVDHARYLVFYVSNVATEENLGLIHKYAERVKQTRDSIDPAKSENIYVLCDLAQAVIRKWQEKRNWHFEAYPGKVGLPVGLFSALPSHEAAQEIAEKQYLPEGMDEKLDELLRAADRKQKRKSMAERGESHPPAKKARTIAPKPARAAEKQRKLTTTKAKTPARVKKAPAASPTVPESERRRSGRARGGANQSYVERDSDDDNDEMLEGVAEWAYEGEEQEGDASDAGSQSAAEDAPEPMDEDSKEEEEEQVEDAEEDEDEGGDEEEEEAAPPKKANGRRSRTAAAPAKSKAAAPAKGKAPAKAAAPPARSGRSTRRAAKDAYDMDD
ncbi:uncharacterized protein E0L32_005729 [Thyridium curvatum]|uniref:Uncharacterized protein n=1 Tax=Thyridium curvatum TaxID=1093900 RepID=A0A507ASK6_9PEZI|nr:uncharacterized protein E0L32_005729 [Thyridium curvatum]TPX13785.1 hypothetical protein E0L32_005729 [Thyridium curvatum]